MPTRRETLTHGTVLTGLLVAGGLLPTAAAAARPAFDARTLADAYKALGLAGPSENKAVTLQAPEIAENGAVVPIGASVALPGVKRLLFLVEKNPSVLIAAFTLGDGVEGPLLIRTKMGQTSDVYAVAVMQDGKVYYARKEVKVTASGC